MGKRFTETTKWQDPWFRELPAHLKALWLFFTDNCDQAGFWKKDYKLASFFMDYPVHEEEFLHVFNQCKTRLKDHGEYLQVLDFIFFQYGVLSQDCKAHKPIFALIDKYEFKGYGNPIERVKEKEIDKEKDKETDKEKDSQKLKTKFGEDGLVLLTLEEHKKLLVKLGERKTAEYITKLNNYIASKGVKYKSHYHTILSWSQNDPLITKPVKREKKIDLKCLTCHGSGKVTCEGRPDVKCWGCL